MRSIRPLVTALVFTCTASAQSGFPPPLAEDIVTIPAVDAPGVLISYRETYICEEQSRAWAGYVHMPSTYIQDVQGDDPYNVSMARVDPSEAPTTIYLAGGAGQSSMWGATSDGGPCYVGADSNSTYNNEWSMNTYVNMLYVDQPVGVGFSYDALFKSTFDALFLVPTAINDTGSLPFSAYDGAVPEANSTFQYGVFPSQQDTLKTANTSVLAARTLWHFTQAWQGSFPEWKTCNKAMVIWGNSYGGFWVPTTAAYFVSQNAKIENGEIEGAIIDVDTIGFTNGCVDTLYQAPYYPELAYNNPYDVQFINKTYYEAALAALPACIDGIKTCRALGVQYDPDVLGLNETVNSYCSNVVVLCLGDVAGVFGAVTNRSAFDMAQLQPNGYPPYYLVGYFNQDWVMRELGVPVNFTQNSNLVANIFFSETGDPIRIEGMKNLEYLLASHVKVALVYGDRDYRCPWNGAEALSLQIDWTGAAEFGAAGYEYVHTNRTYSGGVVRQHGNLSFARVFESGHDVAAYQPETNFHIFNRAVFSRDIATGRLATNGRFNDYSTNGPLSSFNITNTLPPSMPFLCNLYDVTGTCTQDQFDALANGTARIRDFIITSPGPSGGPLVGEGAA